MSIFYKVLDTEIEFFVDDNHIGKLIFDFNSYRNTVFENNYGELFSCGGEKCEDDYLIRDDFITDRADVGYGEDNLVVFGEGALPIGGDVLLVGIITDMYENVDSMIKITAQYNGIVYAEAFDSSYGGGKQIRI